MDAAEYVILGVNLALGLGCAWPLAGLLVRFGHKPTRRLRLFVALIAVYMVEAAAFSASMGTDVLSIVLAFVWGLTLPYWLRRSTASEDQRLKAVRLFSGYTSLPAASFLSVPVVTALGGWSVLSPVAAARFGIPGFLPTPLNTILGFCSAVAVVAVVVKVAVTTGLARVVIRRTQREVPVGAEGYGERAT